MNQLKNLIFTAVGIVVISFALSLTNANAVIAQNMKSLLVEVTNTPLPVTGSVEVIPAEDPDRSAYAKTDQRLDCTAAGACGVTFPAVPAGKRLVVTYVSALLALQGSGIVRVAYLNSNLGGSPPPGVGLRVTSLGPDGNGDTRYAVDSSIRWYVDGSDTPHLDFNASTPYVDGRVVATDSALARLCRSCRTRHGRGRFLSPSSRGRGLPAARTDHPRHGRPRAVH
jgi:hypothetical protein